MYKSSFGVQTRDEYGKVGPSPYTFGETVAVSVGSMLFDPTVFQLVAAHFPRLQFHLVGCGAEFDAPSNVHIHAEMPFDRALAFVKHASIGIAAYAP